MYRSSLCTLNVQPLPMTYISPTQLRLLGMLPLATILRFIRGCGRIDIALVDEAIEVFLINDHIKLIIIFNRFARLHPYKTAMARNIICTTHYTGHK